MIRTIATEIAVCSLKIAAFLVVLFIIGTFAGCGGSVPGEPEDDDQQPTMTVQPVQCAASAGCAK